MNTKAKRRWGILAKAILRNKEGEMETSTTGTKRSFESYNILRSETTEQQADHSWQRVSHSGISVDVRFPTLRLSLEQLVGFNNTGNVCVWPSEECLAVYCLQNRHLAADKTVLELGGGMTCLAGLMLSAVENHPRQIHLTDGNIKSVDNIRVMVDRLKKERVEVPVDSVDTVNTVDTVDTFQLRWDDEEKVKSLESTYDLIICADCLFFKESSGSLASGLYTMLKQGGQAFVMAPNREGTFGHFESLARKVFPQLEVFENYNTEVWKAHESNLGLPEYIPDIHYPKLMVLTKL